MWLVTCQHTTSCACGAAFSVEHALSCPKGGFPSIRHNEIREYTAYVLSEICHNVSVEPHLQPSQVRFPPLPQTGARLDVAADGFWGSHFERAFFDVKVFNPYAPSNRRTQLSTCYRSHEASKKRAYERRILEVEHASVTPLIFSATGGLGREATVVYKRIAAQLSAKWGHSYSSTMAWIQCRLSFSLLRSSIMCIRGAQSTIGHAFNHSPVDLITKVSQVSSSL